MDKSVVNELWDNSESVVLEYEAQSNRGQDVDEHIPVIEASIDELSKKCSALSAIQFISQVVCPNIPEKYQSTDNVYEDKLRALILKNLQGALNEDALKTVSALGAMCFQLSTPAFKRVIDESILAALHDIKTEEGYHLRVNFTESVLLDNPEISSEQKAELSAALLNDFDIAVVENAPQNSFTMLWVWLGRDCTLRGITCLFYPKELKSFMSMLYYMECKMT